jgi:phage-related protein
MAAKAEVHIKGSETVSTAAEKASGSIHQLKGKVQDAIQPMKDLANTVKNLAAFGGMAAGAALVYRNLSDMEKAFEKLHPEVAKMPGSIASWTTAQDELKASIGGLISNFMSPLRESLIDTAAEWTNNINAAREYREELGKLEKSAIFQKVGLLAGVDSGKAGFAAAGLAPGGAREAAALKAAADSLDSAAKMLAEAIRLNATPKTFTPAELAAFAERDAPFRRTAAMEDDAARWVMAGGKAVIAAAAAAAAADLMANNILGTRMRIEAQTAVEATPAAADPRQAYYDAMQIAAAGMENVAEASSAFKDSLLSLAQTMGGFVVDQLASLGRSFVNLVISSEPVRALMDSLSAALAPIVFQLGTLLVVAIVPVVDQLVWLATQIMPFLSQVLGIFGELIAAIMPALGVMNQIIISLCPVVVALGTILAAVIVPVFAILAPVLQMFLGVLEMFWPVLRIFVKAIDAASRPIEFLADIVGFLASYFVWLGKCLADFAHNIRYVLAPPQNTAGAAPTFSSDAFTRPLIDIGAWVAPTAAPTPDNPYAIGGGASSNTTVQHPPDIYVYMTFQGPVFGEGGKREVGEYVVHAIEAYLGTGAHVTFLEN